MTCKNILLWLAIVICVGFILSHHISHSVSFNLAASQSPDDTNTPHIWRHIHGLDSQAEKMQNAEVAQKLNDAFATLVFRSGRFPATSQQLLDVLRPHQASGKYERLTMMIAEGGQLRNPVDDLGVAIGRDFRLVITWREGTNAQILLSIPAGNRSDLLEVVSWDPSKHAFNFYERQMINAQPRWFWLGDTSHAFKQETRGHTCFGCHIHGTLIMKELIKPWNNWESEDATISGIPRDIRDSEPFLQGLTNARVLESIVRAGINQSSASQIDQARAEAQQARDLLPLLKRTPLSDRATARFAGAEIASA